LIQRIFHPIGQGAFYSERHDGFNIVYDCGTAWPNRTKKVFDKVVTQSFSKDDVIDILFISHFDYDHVSKIHVLNKHVKNIKKVVMPLLHEREKTILINMYRSLDFNIFKLISNPGEFFGNGTQIITVNPTDNNTPIDNNETPIDIDDEIDNKIDSGTTLQKNFNKYEWIFIPYNYKYNDKHIKLIKQLKINGFTDEEIEKLQTNSSYTINKIIDDVSKSEKKGGKIFKKAYTKLGGDINENSMLLYSSAKSNSKKWRMGAFAIDNLRYHNQFADEYILHTGLLWNEYSSKVGCIYTGDSNLNKIDIKTIFKFYWSSVGTIQIPHHGDLTSFNKSILDNKHYLCPISVGEYNSYGHPSSKVIADILSQDSHPILVTENLTSSFIERIY